jgi:adenylate cyclase
MARIKHKLLVIDDEPETVELLRRRLERAGYEVITATEGLEGLKKAVTVKPDLILLDIMMPKVDGLTVLRKLRAEEGTCKMPVILVTAKGGLDSIYEAERYGATDYIIKPFQWDELLKFIKRYLSLYGS